MVKQLIVDAGSFRFRILTIFRVKLDDAHGSFEIVLPSKTFQLFMQMLFRGPGDRGYMKISFANNSALPNVDLSTFSRKLQCEV